MTVQTMAPFPRYTTSFIGRETEAAAISDLLISPDTRLITLVGPSGAGKTRLSLRIVEQLIERFPDGALWVDLTPINDPALVLPAVAYTLDIREIANRPLLEALVTAIGERHMVLLLDNGDHVLEAMRDLGALLEQAPNLNILVTSQEALGLPNEHVYQIPPLQMPELTDDLDLAVLVDYSAIALFIERMQVLQPDFELNASNASAVIDICQRAFGLPLAIELIAAHSHQMTPNDLLLLVRTYLPRKDRPRALLRRDILRPVLDWCYRILPPAAQAVFARLSVFNGGWTAEIARKIVCTPRIDMDLNKAIELLVEKHLVTSEIMPDGSLRYSMQDVVREYAQTRLSQRPESLSLGEQHARCFLELSMLGSDGPGRLLARARAEHHNLRRALKWFISRNRINEAVEMAGNLGMYWYYGGFWIEGMLLLRSVEPLVSAAAPVHQAVVYKWLSTFNLAQGDPTTAIALMKRSLRLYEEAGDAQGIISTHNNLGVIARDRGDYMTAETHLREALLGAETLGDRPRASSIANNLGMVLQAQGLLDEAVAMHEKYLTDVREVGEPVTLAFALLNLGLGYHSKREYAVAEPAMREALALYQQIGSKHFLADAAGVLSHICLQIGQAPEARELALEALRLREEINDTRGMISSLEYGTAFALEGKRPELGVMLLVAAERLREQTQYIRSPNHQTFFAEWQLLITNAMSEEDFNQARAEGEQLGSAEAARLLRQFLAE